MMFWRPPINEIPVRVPICGVIYRSHEIAVWLADTQVYTTGVEFHFEARAADPRGGRLNVGGFDDNGAYDAGGPLLVGFEWSDGTTSTNLPQAHNNAGGLRRMHTSAGGAHADVTLTLDHHPPSGPFSLITAWPHHDLPEQTMTFDATAIVEAAATVHVLWDPLPTSAPPAPQERIRDKKLPVVPATGWFAEHYDPTPLPLRPEHGREVTYTAGVISMPHQDPPGWLDGAPTSGEGGMCVFCGSANVAWMHPLDRNNIQYRAYGKGHTLPTYWTLCEQCEQIYQTGDDDAAINAMKNHWIWHDIDESIRKPLQTFRRADKGARRLEP